MSGGVLAMSWNGLSFTAAAEISGGAQAGRAMGMQNTLMRAAGALVPVTLGALAAHGSWRASFLVMGLAPLAGRSLLGPLVADEDQPPPRAPGDGSACGPAQVHRHRHSGEPAPARAREERNDLGHLLGLEQSLDGVGSEHDLLQHALLGQVVRAAWSAI